MDHTMLSIAKMEKGRETYYLRKVAEHGEDLELIRGESPGVWIGSGSARLGLAGEVQAADLRAVLRGVDPRDPGALLASQRHRPDRTPGFDLTFSAPKSVSVLGLVTEDPEIEAAVRVAHQDAVSEAISWLESSTVRARRGRNGAHQIGVEGLVAARFDHRLSRASDPQIHSHVLVAAPVRGVDGRWSALHAAPIYRSSKAAGSVYQAALRRELTRRLGVEWEHVEHGQAEIKGIRREVLDEFSRRRQDIEERLARHELDGARAAQTAALDGRPKSPAVGFDVREEWRERGRSAGLQAGWEYELTERRYSMDRVDVDQEVERAVAELGRDGKPFTALGLRNHVLRSVPHVESWRLGAALDEVLDDPTRVRSVDRAGTGPALYVQAGVDPDQLDLERMAERVLPVGARVRPTTAIREMPPESLRAELVRAQRALDRARRHPGLDALHAQDRGAAEDRVRSARREVAAVKRRIKATTATLSPGGSYVIAGRDDAGRLTLVDDLTGRSHLVGASAARRLRPELRLAPEVPGITHERPGPACSSDAERAARRARRDAAGLRAAGREVEARRHEDEARRLDRLGKRLGRIEKLNAERAGKVAALQARVDPKRLRAEAQRQRAKLVRRAERAQARLDRAHRALRRARQAMREARESGDGARISWAEFRLGMTHRRVTTATRERDLARRNLRAFNPDRYVEQARASAERAFEQWDDRHRSRLVRAEERALDARRELTAQIERERAKAVGMSRA